MNIKGLADYLALSKCSLNISYYRSPRIRIQVSLLLQDPHSKDTCTNYTRSLYDHLPVHGDLLLPVSFFCDFYRIIWLARVYIQSPQLKCSWRPRTKPVAQSQHTFLWNGVMIFCPSVKGISFCQCCLGFLSAPLISHDAKTLVSCVFCFRERNQFRLLRLPRGLWLKPRAGLFGKQRAGLFWTAKVIYLWRAEI